MTDKPIARSADGRPLFDNTPTVVCLLVPRWDQVPHLLVVRRGNQPGKGLLGLPGGYHMRGESWQEAGVREVYEETGYFLMRPEISLYGEPVTDHFGNNMLFGMSGDEPRIWDTTWRQPAETEAVMWLSSPGKRSAWAFPLHYEAACGFFGSEE